MIGFHFILLLKKKGRGFLYGILSAILKNKLDREKDTFYEKFQKITEKCYKKKVTIFSNLKTFKFGFLYFWKSCRELNFLSKDKNPKTIEILSRKL